MPNTNAPLNYDADAPTFTIFYTGTASGDDFQTAVVRAADEAAARANFETHTGPSATIRLIIPAVDVYVA